MKKLQAVFCFIAFVLSLNLYATEHHGGHMGGKRGGGHCTRPRLEKFLPLNMSLVAPGSEFSFVASNIENPEQLTATAKNEPIELSTEFKDPFYVVKGKLPGNLHNTVARINIKVNAKSAHCEAETGWLVKISE